MNGFLLLLLLIPGLLVAQQTPLLTSIPSNARRLEPGKPLARALKAGETHWYQIRLDKGQFMATTVHQQGIDVIIRVFGPNGAKMAAINSSTGEFDDESIALEAAAAGQYRIDISPFGRDAKPGRYEIRVNELLSAQAYATRMAEMFRKQRAVIGWLKANALPLKTVEAGHDFADLQPLKQLLRDVHYVGLGEATHGSREFFLVKHRLLEFLVREMGFRVFALEGSYAALQIINDYVMGRMEDGTKALASQGFWIWNTEEIRAILDWARQYNASVSADQRVKFVGFDIQYNQSGKDKLLAYLKRVAPERVPATEAFFRTNPDSLNSVLHKPDEQKMMQDTLKALQTKYGDLLGFLESTDSGLASKSSPAEYEQMHEYARVLTQYIDSYSRQDTAGSATRDVYMADNFRRLVDRESAGTRFVIWAHNGHVAAGDNGFFRPMGAYLRQLYGNDYYALGLSFNRGSFQAREAQPTDSTKRRLMKFTVSPAFPESVDWYLTQTRLKIFLVDFRSAPTNADSRAWLTTPLFMRSIGSIYRPGSEQHYFYPITVGRRFDGLLFINTTTRARPNPSVKNVAGRDDE